MLAMQDDRCYLCRLELLAEQAVLDHDHRCCGPERSCPRCWRGLAHRKCNALIGWLDESPDRLRMMADQLEEALLNFEALAPADVQLELDW